MMTPLDTWMFISGLVAYGVGLTMLLRMWRRR